MQHQSVPGRIFVLYLAVYAGVGIWLCTFFPAYSWPGGDEGTYYSYAERPWTLQSDFFEGFPPKERISPYNLRGFLTPFSLVFAVFGFNVVAARSLLVLYALAVLVLTHVLARRLMNDWLALAMVVLMSVSPLFLNQTHVVRPEMLFTLGVMVWLWLLIRCEGTMSPRYAAGLGFLAASLLWVHYNAVVFWLIFGLLLLLREGKKLFFRPALAFVAGGAAFGVLFAALNLYPAWSSVSEYGPMPVTFVSSNRIPLLTGDISRSTTKINDELYQWLHGQLTFDHYTAWVTVGVFALAVWGMLRDLRRETSLWGLYLMLVMVAQWLLIPNVRDDHFLYIAPAMFLLAGVGLGRLPLLVREPAIVLALAVSVTAYLVGDFLLLRDWRAVAAGNRAAEAAIARLVDHLGPRAQTTVMSPQEFHAATYGVKFRTYHSIIQTKSVRETLETLRPDMVIMTTRMRGLMPKFVMHPAALSDEVAQRKLKEFLDDAIIFQLPDGRFGTDYLMLALLTEEGLDKEGYWRWPQGLIWSGTEVQIWLRADHKAKFPAEAAQDDVDRQDRAAARNRIRAERAAELEKYKSQGVEPSPGTAG
ncbi:MAG: glycosyltransferase family 39 protein [Pirellulales bacterium]|nr:glycosyltransferase family 39 protein [Pirellulales bacterium]